MNPTKHNSNDTKKTIIVTLNADRQTDRRVTRAVLTTPVWEFLDA